MSSKRTLFGVMAVTATLLGGPSAAVAVTFEDIAAGGGAGLDYNRTPSKRLDILEAIVADGLINLDGEYEYMPYKTYGAPGVAVFDYDNDGDEDIYVTNGPGTPNSLFKNLFRETGEVRFQDVATTVGAALTRQDSQGVCYGDIENDGDLDLFVTGYLSNRLLENQGGRFKDITPTSGTVGEGKVSVSCAMGDVTGDGLLDIFVVNAFDYKQNLAYGFPWIYNQHNQLLINQGEDHETSDGGIHFVDASDASGIRDNAGLSEPGAALVSWSASLIDIDRDGDLDAVVATDQHGNFEKAGYIRIFKNDGTGHFTDVTFEAKMDRVGEWHSLAFGDINCDGNFDIFSTNIGDYVFNPGFYPPGAWSSRWFLGRRNGTFTDPGVGGLVSTPTGWSSTIADYDNDADADIIYHGGWEFTLLWDESNPGVLLENQGCTASFEWDRQALEGSTNHLDRNVEGMATGDFNNDGFLDIVTVSSFNLKPGTPRIPLFSAPQGSPFDAVATFVFASHPTDEPLIWAWEGYERDLGTLAVEINSGNDNGWVAFELLGTKDLVDNRTAEGKVNRDGIGAIVSFRPHGGKPSLYPVLGGSGYASQNSLTVRAGLGEAQGGTVDVFWPGGVRNRLYNVRASEQLVLPEIPCSFDTTDSRTAYTRCVDDSLSDLRAAGVLTQQQASRLKASAVRAYNQAH